MCIRDRDRPRGDEPIMDRGSPERARRLQLAVGPGDGVVQAKDLAHPVSKPGVVGVERCEPADVDRGEVARRFALHDPFGQRPPRSPGRRNPDRVEASSDEEPLDPRDRAEEELLSLIHI